jgi:hypothetical protein
VLRLTRRIPTLGLAAAIVVCVIATAVVIILTDGGLPPTARMSAIGQPLGTVPLPIPTAPSSTDPTPPSATTEAVGAGGGSGAGGVHVGGNPPPGSGQFDYPTSAGPVLGFAGPVRYFQVAVEAGLPMSVADFSDLVDSTLGDPRSWVHENDKRFERVAGASGGSFTIFLASPWTAYQLCLPAADIRIGGVPYTSCQNGSHVVINSARFLGDPGNFTGSMSEYRHYAINHEVGHWLGHVHQYCPGPGELAPVMQQQTLDMAGCLPNGWPYPEVAAPTTTEPPTPIPTPTPTPTATPTPTPIPTPTPTSSPTPAPSPSGSTGTPAPSTSAGALAVP